jgi:alpha-ketoglutarate-dependent taurine dioxygenase
MIHWFVTRIEEGETQLQGTRMPSEHYDSVFFDADEAVERLSSSDHREVVRGAIHLVRNTLSEP